MPALEVVGSPPGHANAERGWGREQLLLDRHDDPILRPEHLWAQSPANRRPWLDAIEMVVELGPPDRVDGDEIGGESGEAFDVHHVEALA